MIKTLIGAVPVILFLASLSANTGEPAKPKFNIKITGDNEAIDGVGGIDPMRRINFGSQGNFFINMSTLQNQPLHLSHFPQFKINGQVHQADQQGRFEGINVPLKEARGKKRFGFTSTWIYNNLRITQTTELYPGKAKGPGQKRPMNTVLIIYTFENKADKAQSVGMRVCMDTYVVTNDGCLFAAPTHPGKVLDGIVLKDKTLPPYVQMLERPNLQNPGNVTHLTLDVGRRYEKINKVVLSSLQVGFGDWEMAVAQAGGDSAISFYWPIADIKPGGKRELAYAYGEGLAITDAGGRYQVEMGGSFEPGKLCTISAIVADPVLGQTMALELPKGIKLLEGKATQPVPHLTDDQELSTVLWKARVLEPGEHTIRIHSSTGTKQTKIVTVTATK